MIQLLYPSSPFSKKEPDESYQAEFSSAQKLGIACLIYSDEDWQQGKLTVTPTITTNCGLIYRGWMFKAEEYKKFADALAKQKTPLLASVKQYLNYHYLPEWYEQCKEFTPQTVFVNKNDELVKILSKCPWKGYFVKDFVKSLTTKRGSIAHSVKEIKEIIALIQKYRGHIEGGICIRELENLQINTEERYFIFKQKAFSRDNSPIPKIVQKLAEIIDSPFFSADVILNEQNELRLIELGDGQVSDLKQWTPEQFVRIFK